MPRRGSCPRAWLDELGVQALDRLEQRGTSYSQRSQSGRTYTSASWSEALRLWGSGRTRSGRRRLLGQLLLSMSLRLAVCFWVPGLSFWECRALSTTHPANVAFQAGVVQPEHHDEATKVRALQSKTRGLYGAPRMKVELDEPVGRNRVARLMRADMLLFLTAGNPRLAISL